MLPRTIRSAAVAFNDRKYTLQVFYRYMIFNIMVTFCKLLLRTVIMRVHLPPLPARAWGEDVRVEKMSKKYLIIYDQYNRKHIPQNIEFINEDFKSISH